MGSPRCQAGVKLGSSWGQAGVKLQHRAWMARQWSPMYFCVSPAASVDSCTATMSSTTAAMQASRCRAMAALETPGARALQSSLFSLT